jgi:stage II sporulation protein D
MAGRRCSGHPPLVPLHAALDLAALRTGPFRTPAAAVGRTPGVGHRMQSRHRTTIPRAALVTALAAAMLLLLFSSTHTLGATSVTPRCDLVNLRTGAATTYAKKTSVNEGALLTVVATVSGGSYGTTCDGAWREGTTWHRISAINGHSVSSLFGVSYVYGASKLFVTVSTPTAAPTAAPTTAPTTAPATGAPSAAPSTGPSEAPSGEPSSDPGSSGEPSTEPSTPPSPSAPPTPTATPGPVTLPLSVTFHGRGYGHGVGLSQYGAYGRALDGQTAAAILNHYYRDTTVGTIAASQVRVLVLQAFAATAANPVQVYGRGGAWSIDGIAKTFPADARLRFVPTTSGGTTTWKALVTAPDGTTLHNAATGSSIRVRPAGGATTLQLWSKPSAYDRYRGVLRLIGTTGGTATVNAVNELPLESYLKGVVPAEVSSTWPAEAVKAQAIAARSYAAYRLHPGTGTYDLYDDTRSQVYQGFLGEKAGTNTAITATANQIVRTALGKIANALFHSCGGGATESNENVFVSSTGAKVATAYWYLRGSMDRRSDGTAYDEASPFDTWSTKTYTLAQVQSWFAADTRTNVGTLVALDLRDRGVSGRLISVTLIGANGSTKKVSGDVFRYVFNAHRPAADKQLRSTLFDLAPVP